MSEGRARAARRAPERVVGSPLALALAASVPAVVIVTLGPVAALAGPASVLAWALSAVVGFLMACSFVELVSRFPDTPGGVAGASAAVLRPRSRPLAALAQWSYWLGWSPSLAISAALIADYVRVHFLSGQSAWVSWSVATAILGLAAFVNHLGIRAAAWFQALLVAMLVVAAAALVAAPVAGDRFHPGRLSLHVDGGWTNAAGLSAFGGALFLAGWSAYAAEVVLTYTAEYRRPARDAAQTVFAAAAAMLVVCVVVPMLLLGGLGASALGHDPTASVLAGGGAGSWVERVAVPVLLLSFALTLNLISGSDARVLYQMSRTGDTWAVLGRLNAKGAPQNALLFDVGANAVYLALGLAVTGGRLAAVPAALLTAASIGYFVSLTIGLVASWVARRERRGDAAWGAPRGLVTFGLVLALFNVMLLVAAASVWGWKRIGFGLLVLMAIAVLGTRRGTAAAARDSLAPSTVGRLSPSETPVRDFLRAETARTPPASGSTSA